MYKMIGKMLDAAVLGNKRVQQYINSRFNMPGYSIINNTYLDDAIYTKDGIMYSLNDQIVTIGQVDDYMFNDIRSTDIVLDIGANIGGFALPASRKARHVFAVEPIFTSALTQNINRNHINTIDVFDVGLGESETAQHVKYESGERDVSLCSLSEIVNMCGKDIDFLKCDCEGGEWVITSRDIRNIRRIEMEVHLDKKSQNHPGMESVLEDAEFYFTKTILDSNCVIYHAINLRIKDDR